MLRLLQARLWSSAVSIDILTAWRHGSAVVAAALLSVRLLHLVVSGASVGAVGRDAHLRRYHAGLSCRSWCTICALALRHLSEALPLLHRKFGASVIAVSGQLPELNSELEACNHFNYPILSDTGA